MRKRGSLQFEANQALENMKAFGRSRDADKKAGVTKDKIYTYKTMRTYQHQAGRFIEWVRGQDENKKTKTLEQSREWVDAYIQHMKDRGDKAASQATAAASLAKLFQCSKSDFAPTDPVRRVDIERSRNEVPSDNRFSEEKNRDLVDVCKATGLRRCEVSALRPDWLRGDAQAGFRLSIPPGIAKGGRPRELPIRGETAAKAVEVIRRTFAGNRVFPRVHTHADIHAYRAEYANSYYRELARDVRTLHRSERYDCRKDKAGIHYDRAAMKAVSEALGHTRVSVIASNYLM
ncbi:hypothetical protein LJC60_00540 [Ruminococcaceae bacterium OttesenSCG-928-D13]|nr:hypothetical protein [Ruminococcaceae bacterium OttesenSCG-928-D13]